MATTSEPFDQRYMQAELVAFGLRVRAAQLRHLLHKAGFRPDQPRVPAGNPEGGQWTDELLHLVSDPNEPPKPPDEKPGRTRQRNGWAQAVARYLAAANTGIEAYAATHWIWEHAYDRIVAYLDEPRFLDELQRAVGERQAGYEVHHIVEQTPARNDGFPESRINGWQNLVRIPTYRHWEITGWYARSNPQFDGLSPREYLRGASWEERYRVGLLALRLYGVLR